MTITYTTLSVTDYVTKRYEMIKLFEALHLDVYHDGDGFATTGVGFNIEPVGDVKTQVIKVIAAQGDDNLCINVNTLFLVA